MPEYLPVVHATIQSFNTFKNKVELKMSHDKENEEIMKKKVDMVELLETKLQGFQFNVNTLKVETDLMKRQFSV